MHYKYFPDLEPRRFFPSELETSTTEEGESSGPVLQLKREITPELEASRIRDMEETLSNYRANLIDRGITDQTALDSFIEGERQKILSEYHALDVGEMNGIQKDPSNWQEVQQMLEGNREKGQSESYEKSEKTALSALKVDGGRAENGENALTGLSDGYQQDESYNMEMYRSEGRSR